MIIIKRLFLRSLILSSVVALCLFMGAYGIARAYENTRRIGFGEYKKAVDVEDGGIRILDFEIMRNS